MAHSFHSGNQWLSSYEAARKNENNRFEADARAQGLTGFYIKVDLTGPYPRREFIHPDCLEQYVAPRFASDVDCTPPDPNRITKIYSP